MSNKTKKLLILNLPYFIAGLVCTNLGEAWRIAEGADMSEKLLGFLSALGTAFSNPMPSLYPMDLLIGVCCGAGLRLAVYLKGKNAKKYKDQNTMLEELYAKFNVSRPDDFTGHSLSVSDIVALRQNGVVSCHYVDSIGFQELPGFLKPENYLKAAEMAMEDDYGMIDGVINNGKKEEPAEKASVLDQLKEKQEAVPPAPPRRCCEEKEL